MKTKVIIGLALFATIFVSACTTGAVIGTDVTSAIKALPEVKSFLQDNPNAQIRAVLWDNTTVSENMDEIKADCGTTLPIKSYYRVEITEANDTMKVWLDAQTQQAVCIFKPATEAPAETPRTQQETLTCTPNWECSEWSVCSPLGTQTRTCTDKNNCGVTTGKPSESQSCTPPKIKSATLSIDRIQVVVANLYPTRVTVTNTGNVRVCPKFDLYVYKGDTEVCSGSPLFSLGCIAPENKKTDEIMIMGCMFGEDGEYTLKIDLLDEDYNKLDSEMKEFTVSYWGQFKWG